MNYTQNYFHLQAPLFLAALMLSGYSFAADYTLENNRWSLLTIPANSSTQSIEQLFEDDLPTSAYGETWAIFTFDQLSQSYVRPAIDSNLAQGDGLWIIQNTGADVTIDLPADIPDGDAQLSNACASTEGCFSAKILTTATRSTWSLLGAPYSSAVDIAKIRITSSNGFCTEACDLEQAKSEGLLLGDQWAYDASSGQYVALSSTEYLQPWSAVWVRSAALPAGTEVILLFPKPDDGNNNNGVLGLHTSYDELIKIRKSALDGNTRYQESIDRIASIAEEGWPYGDVGTPFAGTPFIDSVYDKECMRLVEPQAGGILPNAGTNIYSMVLAYILTNNVNYADQARNIILNFADSSGFNTVIDGTVKLNGANQCALEIALLTPLLIESALLLEAYPGWTSANKTKVQSWLATEVFPVTAAIARTRKNNWGTAAAYASWAVGHYLTGSAIVLNEVYPVAKSVSPATAKDEHLQTQLDIVGNTWAGDTKCEKFGFQPHGGYPDELRRGSTGCDGTYLFADDLSFAYQTTTMEHLIYHAEALRRHGENELYQYKLSNGESLMLKGITFVIDNPNGTSYDWKPTKLSSLRIANSYLNDNRLCEQLAKGIYFSEGRYVPFSQLTYPEVCQ